MSPIPVQDADASTALAQGFGLKGKISLQMDETIVPVALVRDFTDVLDRSPSTIHLSTDGSFIANGSLVGVDYTVPLERRAIIDYVQCVLTFDGDVSAGARMDLRLNFIPAGLASIVSVFASLGPGTGLGNYPFLDVANGQMLAGDRWSLDMFRVVNTPPGRLTSVLHGVEYDESP